MPGHVLCRTNGPKRKSFAVDFSWCRHCIGHREIPDERAAVEFAGVRGRARATVQEVAGATRRCMASRRSTNAFPAGAMAAEACQSGRASRACVLGAVPLAVPAERCMRKHAGGHRGDERRDVAGGGRAPQTLPLPGVQRTDEVGQNRAGVPLVRPRGDVGPQRAERPVLSMREFMSGA